MLERERKFLISPNHRSMIDELPCVNIQQGYIFSNYKMNCRVRIINNEHAYLCLKFDVSKTDRNEFEFEITLEQGLELYELSTYRLEKNRYYVDKNTVIDCYPDGDIIVEIGFVIDLTEIPEFCGEEVTGIVKYNNVHKAIYSGLNGKRI